MRPTPGSVSRVSSPTGVSNTSFNNSIVGSLDAQVLRSPPRIAGPSGRNFFTSARAWRARAAGASSQNRTAARSVLQMHVDHPQIVVWRHVGDPRGDGDATLPLERQLDRVRIGECHRRQNRRPAVFALIRVAWPVAHARHVNQVQTQPSGQLRRRHPWTGRRTSARCAAVTAVRFARPGCRRSCGTPPGAAGRPAGRRHR